MINTPFDCCANVETGMVTGCLLIIAVNHAGACGAALSVDCEVPVSDKVLLGVRAHATQPASAKINVYSSTNQADENLGHNSLNTFLKGKS